MWNKGIQVFIYPGLHDIKIYETIIKSLKMKVILVTKFIRITSVTECDFWALNEAHHRVL